MRLGFRPVPVLVLALTMATTAARAQVVLNEVVPNPAGSSDEFWEFVELYGRPGMNLDGYAVAVLKGGRDADNDGIFDSAADVPEIDEAWSLDGLALGSNGFLVLYNDTESGVSNLISNNLINAAATRAGFTATHIDPDGFTDLPGKIENDGSTTFVLVRRRYDHSLDEFGDSVYGPDYAFRKDIRHDVNADGEIDFGTEVNTIGSGEPARRVEPLQIVDELTWSHEHGKEYNRFADSKFSETPGFNPDAASRLRYYIRNPQRGYFTEGNSGAPFTYRATTRADESFIYGEQYDVTFGNPNFFAYTFAVDPTTGYVITKCPTDMTATRYTGACDPEPDDIINLGCAAAAGGAFEMADLNAAGFKLTPGSFNDHPSNSSIQQFRFLHGDFNCDGLINQIDRRLIEDRFFVTPPETPATLDDVVADTYDPTPGAPGDEVNYDRYTRQGIEFQLVLMMREMDMDDGPGGINAAAVTQDDVDAFLAICPVCDDVLTPPAVRITEYAYSGADGEFVEFTNLSASPVDMTGWSYSDTDRLPGQVDLSAFGVVAPGESVVLTDADRAFFALHWNIIGTKVIGLLDVNLSRNDEINLYDNAGNLADRLTYGDQNFPGTIRTQNFSGWPCDVAIGVNDIALWRLSLAGDAQTSHLSANGDVGNPGVFLVDDCSTSPPVGACCIAGSCTDGPTATQAFCQQSGGRYMGDGVACSGVTCPQPSDAAIRITEFMYDGVNGEFFEITNLDSVAVDLTDWSFDDSGRTPGFFDISGLGTLQPGETGIVSQASAAAFRATWSLPGSQKVVGDLGLNGVGHSLGRNDEINIYDAAYVLVDRLTYGDQDFPGTLRTQNVSAWPCNFAVGANDIYGWTESLVGDVQNSVAAGGDTANPGTFVLNSCALPVGACCNEDGTCDDDITQTGCDAGGGTWQGDGSTCDGSNCPQPSGPMMRITEWMYNVNPGGGEFIEFTNVGSTPVNMTGWSFDDAGRVPGAQSLSAFGIVAPGQAVVLTESSAASFAANWGLSGVAIIGGNTNNLGRNDEINLYDNSNQLVDRLTYGDQDFPGTIQTSGKSGWTCHQNLGLNDVHSWHFSAVGDGQTSHAAGNGEIGSPGVYVNVPCSLCATCFGDADQNGDINTSDIVAFVNCALAASPIENCRCADMVEDGIINGKDIKAFTDAMIGNPGACP